MKVCSIANEKKNTSWKVCCSTCFAPVSYSLCVKSSNPGSSSLANGICFNNADSLLARFILELSDLLDSSLNPPLIMPLLESFLFDR